MLWPARYPEYWGGTLEENRTARKDVLTLIAMFQEQGECGMANNCCPEPYIIQRVDPTTHLVQVSSDNGTTWTPQPGGLPTYIVEPPPPITAGTVSTKCDAANNAMDNVQAWIDHVTNDFDTATSILSFAGAVLEAILVAVVTILSLGTLTAVEAAVLPIIGAACAAAFAAGKTAFVDYWTSDNKEKILCAFFCTIGDDGSFTDAQFTEAWNKINTNLPGNPAKNLLLGFLTSVGRQGLNNMAAQGTNSGTDCTLCDCDCMDNCTDTWTVRFGTPLANTGCILEGASDDDSGRATVAFGWDGTHPCYAGSFELTAGALSDAHWQWYLADGSGPFISFVFPNDQNLSDLVLYNADSTVFSVAVTFYSP